MKISVDGHGQVLYITARHIDAGGAGQLPFRGQIKAAGQVNTTIKLPIVAAIVWTKTAKKRQ